MSAAKQGGKTRQHSPRPGKRLGIKIFGGGQVKTGGIIVRQRGSTFHAAGGTKKGRDFTLFATRPGVVKFRKHQGKRLVYVESTTDH
jgi:large subunit ribosomal protein L27